MGRRTISIVALAGAIALAGCGTSTGGSAGGNGQFTSTSSTAAAPAVVKTGANATGFYNPTTLADSLKTKMNASAASATASSGAPITVNSVDCIQKTDPSQFSCLASLSDGTNLTPSVTVSGDGSGYISQ